jgi:hypothetical protein
LGADVAEHTLAQTALITATSATGQALRSLFSKLVTQPCLAVPLARKLAALDVSYPLAGPAHPLVGTRVTGVEQYLHAGRAIVLNMSGTPLTAPSEYGIGTLADATAAIVRPDGHVWWATDESDVDTATRTALAELGTTF